MPATSRTIYIAGAGVAGLTLALALAKFGARVVVLERNPQIQEFGAGLQISPNARRILNRLGLDAAISEHSFEPQGIDVVPFGAAKPLVTLQLGATARQRFGLPYAVMHRADLVEILYAATRKFANIEVLFGIRNFDAHTQANHVMVAIDEADGRSRHARGFAFVGADGIRSRTRQELLEGPQPQWNDAQAWRVLLDLSEAGHLVATDRTTLLLAPNAHAVCYPLPHRNKLNVALFARAAEAAFPGDDPSPMLPPRNGSPRFNALTDLARGRWTMWQLGAVNAPSWHKDRVGIIGDAAHAMLPFQAQGAAMAIEDAAVLAPLLMREEDPAHAFAAFEALRRKRVARVAAVSRGNGRAFGLEWPLATARNIVLRLGGDRAHLNRLGWLYDYDPLPETELGSARSSSRMDSEPSTAAGR